MSSYLSSIDTDAAIGTILSNFSTEYINHVIDDSLLMKFRPFDTPMPNMVDIFERQFQLIYPTAPDYTDKINDVRMETYKEIINKICNFYNLTFVGDYDSMDITQIYGFARTLYDIFISRFTDLMIDFYVSYIVANADSICAYLNTDENAKKVKESVAYNKVYIDPKYMLIHANANQVIYNMASYDIPLQVLLQYFLLSPVASTIGSMLVDNGDIFKNHYAVYILDQRYQAGIFTNVKLKLQAATQNAVNINTGKVKEGE